MSKRIVFCADGTWSQSKTNTNVYKMFKATLSTPDQIVFYDDGLGTDGKPIQKLTGGAVGAGIDKKIHDGYTKIAQVYEPGDEIFLFGFSRGAYTVRCLASLLCECGLPTTTFDKDLVASICNMYRKSSDKKSLEENLKKYNLFKPMIKFIGVWDTVGSVGPVAFFGKVSPALGHFADTNLHPNILNAYHALAINERRQEFPPTLWQKPDPAIKGQTLEQVWFAGCHEDVGGGFPEGEVSLSEIPFKWMVEKACNLGLQIDPKALDYCSKINTKQALSSIHRSWKLFWRHPKWRTIPHDADLSDSVAIRTEYDHSYRPKNLTFIKGNLNSTYRIKHILNSQIKK